MESAKRMVSLGHTFIFIITSGSRVEPLRNTNGDKHKRVKHCSAPKTSDDEITRKIANPDTH